MGLKMYEELATWWPVLSAPEDYAEEAAFYLKALTDAAAIPLRDVLELGSGGGNNASHLKAHFRMTLVDRAPEMLAVSRALNPDCDHVEGDMRTVRLGRQFDAVFVHDAISYLTTEADIRQALGNAFRHTRPGGAALFAPDHVVETFHGATSCGGHDGQDGRAMRYLEWEWDPDPADSTITADFVYLLREADGATRVEHDRHVMGLFPRAFWLRAIEEAGFAARGLEFHHSELEPGSTYELFVGVRPLP